MKFKARWPTIWEAVASIAAVVLLLYTINEHHQRSTRAEANANHEQIIEAIKAESVERKATYAEFKASLEKLAIIVTKNAEALSAVEANQKIVLHRLGLSSNIQDGEKNE